MSAEVTKYLVSALDKCIQVGYEKGEPITLPIDGRPAARIISLKPPIMEKYGTWRNRGPHLVGEIALRGLFISEGDGQTDRLVMGVVEAKDSLYGYRINGEQTLKELAFQARLIIHGSETEVST